jgi:hypothetical protein
VTDARMHSGRLSHRPVHEESSLRRRRIATELPGLLEEGEKLN